MKSSRKWGLFRQPTPAIGVRLLSILTYKLDGFEPRPYPTPKGETHNDTRTKNPNCESTRSRRAFRFHHTRRQTDSVVLSRHLKRRSNAGQRHPTGSMHSTSLDTPATATLRHNPFGIPSAMQEKRFNSPRKPICAPCLTGYRHTSAHHASPKK